MLNPRAVAVVVDPVQSVKGKIVIDAFRSIDKQVMMSGTEPRQTTSNIGHIQKPSRVAEAHGLNRFYYSIAINYRKNEFEQKMLANLHKNSWSNSLKLSDFGEQHKTNISQLKEFSRLTGLYNKWIKEETKMKREEFVVYQVGKLNPKSHLQTEIEETLNTNVIDCLGTMLNTVVF
jgi:26S proteasome regulatory subunit N11